MQHVSSGDLLRAHIKDGTPLGKEAKSFIDKGDLVPDATMVGLISGELKAMSSANWLLDGFPRTLAQAQALQGPYSLGLNSFPFAFCSFYFLLNRFPTTQISSQFSSIILSSTNRLEIG